MTNKGTMVAKLTFEKTPVTVANFVALAEGVHPMVDSTFVGKKYYNGLQNEEISGDYINNSKNTRHCFNVESSKDCSLTDS